MLPQFFTIYIKEAGNGQCHKKAEILKTEKRNSNKEKFNKKMLELMAFSYEKK